VLDRRRELCGEGDGRAATGRAATRLDDDPEGRRDADGGCAPHDHIPDGRRGGVRGRAGHVDLFVRQAALVDESDAVRLERDCVEGGVGAFHVLLRGLGEQAVEDRVHEGRVQLATALPHDLADEEAANGRLAGAVLRHLGRVRGHDGLDDASMAPVSVTCRRPSASTMASGVSPESSIFSKIVLAILPLMVWSSMRATRRARRSGVTGHMDKADTATRPSSSVVSQLQMALGFGWAATAASNQRTRAGSAVRTAAS
jgi:hypothetical protein